MRYVINIIIEDADDEAEYSLKSVGAAFVDQGGKLNLGGSIDFLSDVLRREMQMKSPHVCEIRYGCRRSS